MRTGVSTVRLTSVFGAVVDALGDPRRQHRTAAALIVVYVLLWWAYAVIAKSTQGLHIDMGEQFAWSLQPAFGYPKHPPFCAWVMTLWFAIFPRADWAYYLLSVSVIGVACWFIWLIVARMVESGEKRAVALMFLAFAPTFNFLPLKYNPNSMLIPVWALACWLFLRSFERRTLLWGVAAGLGAALAMLTKYWSIFLIAGFAAAALTDPRRGEYFRSPAPWASAIAGAALLAPNIVSLMHYDFAPFHYAIDAHTKRDFADTLFAIGKYLTGVLYIAGGFLALTLAARPDADTWRDMVWPPPGDRRLMLTVTLVALLSPVAYALAFNLGIAALWTMPCWAMLPAILLSSPRVSVTRLPASSVVAAAFLLAVAALAASPVVARAILQSETPRPAIYYQAVAHEVDRLWPQVSGKPLPYVTGAENLAWACSFYCRSRPQALPDFSFQQAPWIDRNAVLRQGYVALCPAANDNCLNAAQKFAGDGADIRKYTIELTRHGFDTVSMARRFTFIVSPPRQPEK